MFDVLACRASGTCSVEARTYGLARLAWKLHSLETAPDLFQGIRSLGH
jgi:hypothetical protein